MYRVYFTGLFWALGERLCRGKQLPPVSGGSEGLLLCVPEGGRGGEGWYGSEHFWLISPFTHQLVSLHGSLFWLRIWPSIRELFFFFFFFLKTQGTSSAGLISCPLLSAAAEALLGLGLERRVVCVSGSAWGRPSQISSPLVQLLWLQNQVSGCCQVYCPLGAGYLHFGGEGCGGLILACLPQTCSGTPEADPWIPV